MNKDIRSITILGREHTDRSGNTYFTSKIYIDGEYFDGIKYEYGYGTHYLDRSTQLLEKAGILAREHPLQPYWQIYQDANIKLVASLTTVQSKKALKRWTL